MGKPEDKTEREESLDKFRKQYPGLWEQFVELFGEWEESEPE